MALLSTILLKARNLGVRVIFKMKITDHISPAWFHSNQEDSLTLPSFHSNLMPMPPSFNLLHSALTVHFLKCANSLLYCSLFWNIESQAFDCLLLLFHPNLKIVSTLISPVTLCKQSLCSYFSLSTFDYFYDMTIRNVLEFQRPYLPYPSLPVMMSSSMIRTECFCHPRIHMLKPQHDHIC